MVLRKRSSNYAASKAAKDQLYEQTGLEESKDELASGSSVESDNSTELARILRPRRMVLEGDSSSDSDSDDCFDVSAKPGSTTGGEEQKMETLRAARGLHARSTASSSSGLSTTSRPVAGLQVALRRSRRSRRPVQKLSGEDNMIVDDFCVGERIERTAADSKAIEEAKARAAWVTRSYVPVDRADPNPTVRRKNQNVPAEHVSKFKEIKPGFFLVVKADPEHKQFKASQPYWLAKCIQ